MRRSTAVMAVMNAWSLEKMRQRARLAATCKHIRPGVGTWSTGKHGIGHFVRSNVLHVTLQPRTSVDVLMPVASRATAVACTGISTLFSQAVNATSCFCTQSLRNQHSVSLRRNTSCPCFRSISSILTSTDSELLQQGGISHGKGRTALTCCGRR